MDFAGLFQENAEKDIGRKMFANLGMIRLMQDSFTNIEKVSRVVL